MAVYYHNNLIEPAPQVSIAYEPIYANDNIIGYIYRLTLTGFASTYKKSTNSGGQRFFGKVVKAIEDLQKIIMVNGGELRITDPKTNNLLLKAAGGIVRSINFEPGNSNWTTYAPYTIEMEFNELNIGDDAFGCSAGFATSTNNLIKDQSYKIKNFRDSWTFDISQDVYRYDNNIKNINDSMINVTYNLSATGRHYFSSSGTLLPAWVQAKQFVQEKLIEQVTALNTNGILKLESGGTSCNSVGTNLDSLHNVSASDGALSITENNYKIYNESINYSISEAEGSFDATYTCILKKGNPVKHTISKDVSYSSEGNKDIYTISIKGSIEGLVERNLINGNSNFEIDNSNGQLLQTNSYNGEKYTNAENFYNSEQILETKEGGTLDLTPIWKSYFDVTAVSLAVTASSNCGDFSPNPASANLTKNYITGTIEYSIEYNTNTACLPPGGNLTTIATVDWSYENSNNLIAEHPIPQSNHFIQKLHTTSSRKVTMTIEGRSQKLCLNGITGCGQWNLGDLYSSQYAYLPESINGNNIICVGRETSYNPTQGSYRTTLSYICARGQSI